MSKEIPGALLATNADGDSHEPSIKMFCNDAGLFSNLTLEANSRYSIQYPNPIEYSETSLITKAEGMFEITDDEPWLDDATVWYAGKPKQSNGAFYVTIVEGTLVINQTTGEKIIVEFPDDIQGKSFRR